MPVYDCTFILNPQLEESVLEGHIKSAKDLIEQQGGKIVTDNRIGMRRLAYEINKLTQGYYVSLVFDGTGEMIKALERQFRLEESVLRFLTCMYKEFEKREIKPGRRPYSDDKPSYEKRTPDRRPAPSTAPAAVAKAPEPTVEEKPAPKESEEL
ncbi:MAG: 30S ribosomal protein S6 [FCB group bacterium]|nr:30S ribosomal protein S6 [FCB group bacterium]